PVILHRNHMNEYRPCSLLQHAGDFVCDRQIANIRASTFHISKRLDVQKLVKPKQWEYAITLVKAGGIRMNADRAVALLFQPGSQGRHRPSRAYCAIGVEAMHTQSAVFNTAQEGKLR